jgi:hypothetical protein
MPATNVLSGSDKLKLIKELGMIRKNMSDQRIAGVNKITLVKRVREIRVLLSVKVEKAVGLVLDLTDKQAAFSALEDYAVNGIKAMPEALQRTESRTIQQVFNFVNKLPGDNLSPEKLSSLRDVFKLYEGRPEESAFDYFSKSGATFETESAKARFLLDAIKEAEYEETYDSPEVIAQKQRIFEDSIELRSKIDALDAERSGFDYGDGAYAAITEIMKEVYKKIDSLDNLEYSLSREKYNAKQAKIATIREQLKEPGQLIINTLLSASPVTQEQADQWASAQVIDKTSIAKLSKRGYKHADIRRDMAEFYRISGGKLRNIAITSNGSRRANASGIGEAEDTAIHPGQRFDKEVLWHELAHHLEADPAAKQAANDFLVKRRESESVYSLRSLTGNKGYSAREVAYKDSFISPYIGKVYQNQVTEVYSMGVQYLSNPELAASFIAKDPEMASLIAGYLQAELSPAMKALQQVQGVTAQGNQAKRDDAESRYQDAIKQLSGDVNIVDDGWFSGLDDNEKELVLYESYGGVRDKNAKFLGSWGFFRVFEGKFKNENRRVAKGYTICYENRWSLRDTSTSYNRIVVPGFTPLFGDIETIKAAMKIAKESFDGEIYQVAWRFFGKNNFKGDIIEQAKKISGNQQ